MKGYYLLFVFITFFTFNLFGQESKTVTVLWDASLSMQNRDIEKDLSFLEKYLKTKNTKVKLVVFNNQVKANVDFTEGNFSALRQKLKSTTYDGATDYSFLPLFIDGKSEVLFFTDGLNTTNDNLKVFNANGYVINSKKNRNEKALKMFVGINQATLVDFSEKQPIKNTSNIIKYTGTVYNNNKPVKNAKLNLNDSNKLFFTDELGRFSIQANKGSVLNITYGEFFKKHVLSDEVSFNVNFLDEGESLNEVNVKGVVDKDINVEEKKLTAYGYKNPDKIGYAVQSITDKDIAPTSTNASMAVKGKFSSVRYGDNQDLTQAVIRGGTGSLLLNNYGLVIVDGVPLQRSNSASGFKSSSLHINPDNIANVTVLKGLAATNRYGSEGNGGVILITTKTATPNLANKKKSLTVLNNNIYDDKKLKKASNAKIPYITALTKFKNLKDAYVYYLKDRTNYLKQPAYFINVYQFFKQTDQKVANTILSNIIELFHDDISAMKTLAFVYESEGNYQEALTIYKRILLMNRKSSQAHLDILNTNNQIKDKVELKRQLLKIATNKLEGVNFSGLNKTLTNDIREILRNDKLGLKEGDIGSKYFYNTKYDTRIVLRWNNPNAEFNVQFVNPMKRFINWEHTTNANNSRLIEEKEQGYSTEEFHINAEIKELKGEWIMNITDYDSSNAPNYFLITVYKNFGKPNQSKEVKLFTSTSKGESQNVLKFKI